ncbi:MAG: integrase core domain-containing protein [Candidatus Competibacteraceae bacterium]
MRRAWISHEDPPPLIRQCALAGVSRATCYAHQRATLVEEDDAMMLRLIDEEYTRHPFFGSRRMVGFLRQRGFAVNRKRVQHLMPQPGLAGMAPGPHTSQSHPARPVYPCLLRGLAIRPAQSGVEYRTDQGAQFASHDFINALKAHPLRISMDGRGRAADNTFVERLWRTVKYENIYLKAYETLAEVQVGLKTYFTFYNGQRGHQSLGYQTPDGVYATGQGGGAKIIDQFGRLAEPVSAPPPEDEAAPGQRAAGLLLDMNL